MVADLEPSSSDSSGLSSQDRGSSNMPPSTPRRKNEANLPPLDGRILESRRSTRSIPRKPPEGDETRSSFTGMGSNFDESDVESHLTSPR